MSEVSINEHEAPAGFYAVLKSSLPKNKGNLCSFCDWRKTCQDPHADFEDSNNRCMGYPITSEKTEKVIVRKDGCSVIFKRRADYEEGD